MDNRAALGSWIRRFLMEYLIGERNLARNTQQSYRDAVRLLVVFAAAKTHKKVDELLILDIDADLLRAFLRHIEEKRKCSISSRNQRLAAIHALAGFIAERCPEYLDWCAQLRVVKSKRSAPVPVCYLEKPEIDALLDAPSSATKLGNRDRALLLFLYNSGARAEEAKTVHRRSQPAQRRRRCLVFGVSSRQGWQGSHLSALDLHNRKADAPCCRAEREGTSLPQSLFPAAYTLRHPRHRDAICERRHEECEGDAQETSRPTYHPPHHSHTSSSRRRRHQHHQHLRRNRP